MAINKVQPSKEEIKNPVPTETGKTNQGKKIEINPDEEIEDDETIHADFEDESEANKFASAPTKESKAAEEIDPHTSAEEIKRQVETAEANRSGKLEYKDLKQTAEFIITLMDTAFSTLFKIIARDTSRQVYEMPSPNKKILVEQLALILSKYQSKFKIEFLFFMGIVVLYAPMAIEAFKVRKLTSKKKPAIEPKKSEAIVQEVKTVVMNEENVTQQSPPAVDSANTPFRRKKGKQAKA